jgi:hypothetical protein
VLLPNAPLDYSAVTEAHLLRSGRSGLRLIDHLRNWTVYALPHPTPILTDDRPAATASVLSLTDSRIRVWLPTAGSYDLRVRFSPYWSTDATGVCLSATPSGMTRITVPRAEPLAIEFEPTLATIAAAAASDTPACAT